MGNNMKYNTFRKSTQLFIKVAASVALLLGTLWPAAAAYAASSASISLSPSASSVVKDTNFVITVQVTTNFAFNAAEAHVTFDASKVNYISPPDYSGSPLGTDSPGAGAGAGYVHISRGAFGTPAPAGTVLLAKLNFKALTDTGSAAFAIDKSQSDVYDPGTNTDVLASVSGTSVSFAPVPAAAPSPAPTSGSPKVTAPATGAKAATPAATTVKLAPGTSLTPDPGPVAAQPVAADVTPTKVSVAVASTTKKKSLVTSALIGIGILAVLAALGTVGRTLLIKRRANGLRFGGYVAGSVPATPAALKVQPAPTTVEPAPTSIPITTAPTTPPNSNQAAGMVISPTAPEMPANEPNNQVPRA